MNTNCLAVILVIGCASALAQDEPITRVTVNQVRIDAVVSDSQGHSVRDLGRDDFEVFQDGRQQLPISVSYVGQDSDARTVVVILNDFDMSVDEFLRSRQAVKQYLADAMRPGDQMAVLRSMQTSGYMDPFMTDPATLRVTIDQMRYEMPSPMHFTPVLYLLGSTISVLRQMPGRKSVIVFSKEPAASPSYIDDIRRLADSALRASIKIYGIDPAQLQASIPSSPKEPQSPAPVIDGFRLLAEQTGGLRLENSNDLGVQFARVLDDHAGYYLIAWNPGEKAFASDRRSAPFHKITVKLNRPGLTVRTPAGYYGYESATPHRDRLSPRTAMLQALFAPFHSGRFDMRMNSAFELRDGRAYIRSFVFIPGKNIEFRPSGPDCHTLSLEFLTLPQPIDPEVRPTTESQITTFEACGPAYDAISHNGLAVTMLHPISEPGGYQMRLAVRNTSGTDAAHSLPHAPAALVTAEEADVPTGSAWQLVLVPDWRKEPLISGLHLQSSELPPLVDQPVLPNQTKHNGKLAYRPAAAGDPAVRMFRPSETLVYRARIANVIKPSAQIRISRTEDPRTEVYRGAADSVSGGVVNGAHTLDQATPAGKYLLQLIVNGTYRRGKAYHGTAEIDFSVIPAAEFVRLK